MPGGVGIEATGSGACLIPGGSSRTLGGHLLLCYLGLALARPVSGMRSRPRSGQISRPLPSVDSFRWPSNNSLEPTLTATRKCNMKADFELGESLKQGGSARGR